MSLQGNDVERLIWVIQMQAMGVEVHFQNKSARYPVKTLWYFPLSSDIKLHDEGLQVSSCNTFFLGLDSLNKQEPNISIHFPVSSCRNSIN